MAQPPSAALGRYRLDQALQTSNWGTTWLATDHQRGCLVIVKELRLPRTCAADEGFKRLELFEREGSVLKFLTHPGLPRLVESFRVDAPGQMAWYNVFEHRGGQTLAELVASGWRATPVDVADVLCQVAGILDYLHGLVPPLVHRDVTPRNILRGPDGRIALLDLGSVGVPAAFVGSLGGSTVVGTPGFTPLEQFAGRATAASDIYALGMVGVFLLTHREPTEFLQHDGRCVLPPAVVTAYPALARGLQSMVQPWVQDRLQDAGQVGAALRGQLGKPTTAGPSGSSRGAWMVYVGALVASAGLAAAGMASLRPQAFAPGPEPVAATPVWTEERLRNIHIDEIQRPEYAEVRALLGSLVNSLVIYHGEYGSYITDLHLLGFRPHGKPRYLVGFRGRSNAPVGGRVRPERNHTLHPEMLAEDTFDVRNMVDGAARPLTPEALPANTTASENRFLAAAVGNLDDDATLDVWTVDQRRVYEHVVDDTKE